MSPNKSHWDVVEHWEALARSAGYSVHKRAAVCQCSVRELERFFRARRHQTPHEWLDEFQLTDARRRLLEGWKVNAVACDLGFKDASHFCRKFKRHYGLTPLAYILTVRRAGPLGGP